MGAGSRPVLDSIASFLFALFLQPTDMPVNRDSFMMTSFLTISAASLIPQNTLKTGQGVVPSLALDLLPLVQKGSMR
jgi:hypothetical protein